jgi:hypothetical protein
MKNNKQLLKQGFKNLCLLLLLFGMVSCEKLDVDTPDHLLTGELLFQDPNAVEAALVGIYASLRDKVLLTGSSQGLSNLLGNYTDELDYYSTFGLPEEQFYLNTLAANDRLVTELWNKSYNQIYAANAILEGVEGSPYFTTEEQAMFKGEALFVRGMIHFYLLNLYGDIPYITTTNYLENKRASRQPTAEVYALVIADLMQAKELLPEMDNTGEHLRPTTHTAIALLSRIYLYMEKWEEAEQFATEVIGNNGWESNIENVFLKTSASTLWQFSPDETRKNTLEAQTFLVFAAPPSTLALSDNLAAAFEPADLRKEHWVGEVSDGTKTWYFPYKYKLGFGTNSSEEYSIVLRMAEQYLIRAEARVRKGDIMGAKDDINKIRTRAGLGNTTATSQSELLAAILQERRIELFTEHGHRFFDLKRNNQLDAVLGLIKPGWNTTDALLPIPADELLTNPNLQPQNPGY